MLQIPSGYAQLKGGNISNMMVRPSSQHRCRSRRSTTRCLGEIEGAGASGYAVEGNRPTSPKAWEIMSTTLRKSGTKMISPQELVFAQKRKAVILDIRPGGEFAESRIPGAVSAQFYRLIEGWSAMQLARRITYAFFGILNGTEFNERFFDEVAALVKDKKTPIVVYCNIGGTLEPTGPSEFGKQSRCLSAAYELQRNGYKNVTALNGGFNEWRKTEREVEVNGK